MTFKDIKVNNPVFILDKKSMELKKGNVTAVAPHLNMGSMNTLAGNGQPMVDVTIEIDGKLTAYTIPEGLAVTYAGDTVLATVQESLTAEVERAVDEARQGLRKTDYWNMVVEKSPDLLAQLNPQLREKQETEKRLAKMEESISKFGSMMEKLVSKFS